MAEDKLLGIGTLVEVRSKGRIAHHSGSHGVCYKVELERRDFAVSARTAWFDPDEICLVGEAPPESRARAWWLLARLAVLVERGEATLTKDSFKTRGDGRVLGYEVHIDTENMIHQFLEPGEAAQIAESLSTLFAERAMALGLDPGRAPGDCTSECRCVTCGSEPGVWCRATHAGEKDSGGWTHPGREAGSTLVGPMADAAQVRSAMHRFPNIQFRTPKERGLGIAQIAHAATIHEVDITTFITTAAITPRRRDFDDDADRYDDVDE